MSYQQPPQVSFGEEITALVVNQLRLGLTQYETFFNFTSPPPDIRMLHTSSKFVMWSFYTTNDATTLQFNAASFWDAGVAASLVIVCLSTTVSGAYFQLMRPWANANSVFSAPITFVINANGDVTAQKHINYPWVKALFILSVTK